MTSPQPPILEVRGLVKQFPIGHDQLLTAVNRVSFSVNVGETLAVVGESGSGKTTVGRCVLRLLRPTAGSVSFEATDITRRSPRQLRQIRQRMQVVFQDPYDSLDPRMRIKAIIEEPLKIFAKLSSHDRTSRVTELLEQVHLAPEMGPLANFNALPSRVRSPLNRRFSFSMNQPRRWIRSRGKRLSPYCAACRRR